MRSPLLTKYELRQVQRRAAFNRVETLIMVLYLALSCVFHGIALASMRLHVLVTALVMILAAVVIARLMKRVIESEQL